MQTEYKFKVKERGIFDIIHVDTVNCTKKYLFHDIAMTKEKDENPRPFIDIIDIVKECTGSADGRVWIPFQGNLHGTISCPTTMFKSVFEVEFFPVLASFAIRDTMNKYAPGEYCSKWPNDVVCKKHGRKTCGMLCRKEGRWIFLSFGLNLVKAPDDKMLRKQGLRACCMKEHTQNIPVIEDFFYECATHLLDLIKEYNTIEKVVDLMNLSLNEYQAKTYRVEINNPNADLLKDGTLWNKKFPNALTKGYMNGVPYEFNESYFDREYYKTTGNADEKQADKNHEENKKLMTH